MTLVYSIGKTSVIIAATACLVAANSDSYANIESNNDWM